MNFIGAIVNKIPADTFDLQRKKKRNVERQETREAELRESRKWKDRNNQILCSADDE